MKKVQVYAVGIVVFFIVMICGLTFLAISINGGRYEEAYPEPDYVYEEEVNYSGEFLGDGDIPLPEGYENFTHNGVWITLPTTGKEIAELGYAFEGYDLSYMFPENYIETISLVDEDGDMIGMVTVTNNSDGKLPLESCTVEDFYISNPAAYDEMADVPEFEFGDGMTFESSYEEIEAYLGAPYYHYEDHSEVDCYYDSYQWEYYGDDERHFVMINFWNGEISDISIAKEYYD